MIDADLVNDDDLVPGGPVPREVWVQSWLEHASNDIAAECDDIYVTWADWASAMELAFDQAGGMRAKRAVMLVNAIDTIVKDASGLDRFTSLAREANLSEKDVEEVLREALLGKEANGSIGPSSVTWGDVHKQVVQGNSLVRFSTDAKFEPAQDDWVGLVRRRLFGSDVNKLPPQSLSKVYAVGEDNESPMRQWLPNGPDGITDQPSLPLHVARPTVPVMHGQVVSYQRAISAFRETVGHYGFIASIFRTRRYKGNVEVPRELVAYLQGVKMFRAVTVNLLSELKAHCVRWFAENGLDNESHEWRTRVMRWAIIAACLPSGDDENAMTIFENPEVYEFIQRSNEWLNGSWKDRRSWLLRQMDKFRPQERARAAPTSFAVASRTGF